MQAEPDARNLNDEGRFDEVLKSTEAELWLESALATERAIALFRLGRLAEAQYLLGGAAQAGHVRAKVYQAVILMHLGELQEASQRLRTLLPHLSDADLVDAQQWFAGCLGLLGRTRDALAEVAVAIQNASRVGLGLAAHGEALLTRAALLLQNGAYRQALAELESASTLLKRHPDVLMFLRLTHLHLRALLALDQIKQASDTLILARKWLASRVSGGEIAALVAAKLRLLETVIEDASGTPRSWGTYSALMAEAAGRHDLEVLTFELPREIERNAEMQRMDEAMQLGGQWPGYQVGASQADMVLGIAFALTDNRHAAQMLLRRAASSPQASPRTERRSALYLAMTEYQQASPDMLTLSTERLRTGLQALRQRDMNAETRRDLRRLAVRLPEGMVASLLDPVARYQLELMSLPIVEAGLFGEGTLRLDYREVMPTGSRTNALLLLRTLAEAEEVSSEACIEALCGIAVSDLDSTDRRWWQQRVAGLVSKLRDELGTQVIETVGAKNNSAYRLNTRKYQFVVDTLQFNAELERGNLALCLGQLQRGLLTAAVDQELPAAAKLRAAFSEDFNRALERMERQASTLAEQDRVADQRVLFEALDLGIAANR